MSLTTAIGVTAACWVERSERLAQNEIQEMSVTLTQPTLLIDDEDPQFTEIVNSLRIGEFYATGHACGNGFVTGYVTVGRQRLSHSYEAYDSVGEARSGFKRELAKASVIVEGPVSVIRDGKSATRFLLKREEDENTFFEIIWLEKRGTGFTAIAGPDEDNTRRLEAYVLSQR